MAGRTLSLQGFTRPRARLAVALLGGNVDELPLLRAAHLTRVLYGASVRSCWVVEGEASPVRPLIRELALDADVDELPADDFPALLDQGRVNTVMLAPTLWRRLGGGLFRRLRPASAYICLQGSLS